MKIQTIVSKYCFHEQTYYQYYLTNSVKNSEKCSYFKDNIFFNFYVITICLVRHYVILITNVQLYNFKMQSSWQGRIFILLDWL